MSVWFRQRRAILAMSLLAASQACATMATARATGGRASARVVDNVNNQLGTVTFTETPNGLLIEGTIAGLGLGRHAVHIHQVGRCEPPFTTAGPHYNPGNRQHGLKNPNGAHAGDLPNIVTPASGAHSFEILAPAITLSALLDSDGASIVFHSSADDHVSAPEGAAGARLACGVIRRL